MYYLVTGIMFIEGKGLKDVREIADQPGQQEARAEVENRLAPRLPFEWISEPDIVELPEDMKMRHVIRAQELPGL